MNILDIRKEQEKEITGIKFDQSSDYIDFSNDFIMLKNKYDETNVRALCKMSDINYFIAALHKAKELAGK